MFGRVHYSLKVVLGEGHRSDFHTISMGGRGLKLQNHLIFLSPMKNLYSEPLK
jgi:hypothetical protein